MKQKNILAPVKNLSALKNTASAFQTERAVDQNVVALTAST